VFAAKRLIARWRAPVGLPRIARIAWKTNRAARRGISNARFGARTAMYALALDGAKSPAAWRTSNSGQVLFTGIARADLRDRGDDAVGADLFSGGDPHRSRAREIRYNPMSYHNGRSGRTTNALIAVGLATDWRQGCGQSHFQRALRCGH